MTRPDIRVTEKSDWQAVQTLYPIVFPEENLLPLVQALLAERGVLSLAADGDGLIGHIAFTPCAVGRASVSLLGPLAVAPQAQRQGVGSGLVQAGLDHLRQGQTQAVLVLGDPRYYGRFGFAVETEIEPPHAIPDAWRSAWQSIRLASQAQRSNGTLAVPPAWNRPELWR